MIPKMLSELEHFMAQNYASIRLPPEPRVAKPGRVSLTFRRSSDVMTSRLPPLLEVCESVPRALRNSGDNWPRSRDLGLVPPVWYNTQSHGTNSGEGQVDATAVGVPEALATGVRVVVIDGSFVWPGVDSGHLEMRERK